MRRLTYVASPRHRLVIEGEEVARGGETFEVDDETAERLLASRHTPTTEVMPEAESGEGFNHEEENPDG